MFVLNQWSFIHKLTKHCQSSMLRKKELLVFINGNATVRICYYWLTTIFSGILLLLILMTNNKQNSIQFKIYIIKLFRSTLIHLYSYSEDKQSRIFDSCM